LTRPRRARLHTVALLALVATGDSLASRATDNAFSAAREAFRDGATERFERHAAKLEDHVLQPYIDYWRLRMRIENVDAASVDTFLRRMEGQYLADRLRHDWARLQAKRGDWRDLLATIRNIRRPDPDIPCLAAQAQLALSESSAVGDARPLWLSGGTLSDACELLFDQLRERGHIDASDLHRRRLLALDTGDARLLTRLGGGDWALDPVRLQRANEQAEALLAAHRTGARPDVALLVAILRRARLDPLAANESLQAVRSQLAVGDARWMSGRLAFYAARQHLPQSLYWFAQADPTTLGDDDWAWQTRLALRRGDWQAVLQHIDRLSRPAQEEQVWRFWKARALQAGGREGEANAILAGLANEPTFYGLLAGEALGPSIGERQRDYVPSSAEVKAVATRPGFARGLELRRLGFDFEASREWSWGITELSDEQLIAAAELAQREAWFERSIWTAERTRRVHNYALRYPTPFRDQVHARASHHTVDPALLYGLIRQESRFNPQATSPAGARGLMQVMPATAHWLAGKLGMRKPNEKALGDPGTNVQLGSAYVRHLLDTLEQSPVLVAAGYNAGPRRAQRWRDQRPLEGAIYAESIPILETRDYVKKVLANATVYGRQFGGGALSLRDRLGIIPARPGAPDWEKILIDTKDLGAP
jgi:soluble lytic murein transglycosylase